MKGCSRSSLSADAPAKQQSRMVKTSVLTWRMAFATSLQRTRVTPFR
ncbi:hypothetical protein CCHR01_15176 [Colletotrichum chrysophilum]|uniref:Uncharacterized protein n=1 Tax=Colletotrichum chrysophilum TaxID=1836956 RepID=A0AAD9A646_9PEZI|nr:hypothetical protein CCHR01_15176 [Colletotrichum chrysophilum]